MKWNNTQATRSYYSRMPGDAIFLAPFEIANAINPAIDSYLQSHPAWNTCGVIFVNFAGGCDYSTSEGTFTACTDFVQHIIDHSNYTHPEVAIGTQTWMKMNLSTSFYSNGDPIPNVTNAQQWIQLKTGAYRCYNDNPNTFPWIGKLYNYYALHDPRGICPKGYHVPTDADWEKLISYLGGPEVAGGKLKDTLDDWHHQITWNQPNTGATNSSGFTACGAGYWFYGDYYNMLNMAVFFGLDASHDSASTYALYNNSAAIQHYADTSKGYYGMSVRCIKN